MATLLPVRPPSRFLRYQFDSAAQLRRHCRLVDGRVLLFFPVGPALPPRSRALIELCFSHSAQQVSLAAVVHSRELEGVPGTWLEMRALSVVAGLQSAVIYPRRQQRRLALDQLAWVSHDGGAVLACPVLDISRGGARLWGIPGAAPCAGEKIRLRMQQAPTLTAFVTWAHGREVGVAFAPESLDAAAGIYSRIESMWGESRFARHNPSCACTAGGAPLDPPSPMQTQAGALR